MSNGISFQDFWFDPENLRLVKAGKDLPDLQFQQRVLLKLLLQHAPAPVSYDQLVAGVLGVTTVDKKTKHSIRQAVDKLRKQIGDVIETQYKIGYRFMSETNKGVCFPTPRRTDSPAPVTACFTLAANRAHPQLADYLLWLAPAQPFTLKCRMSSASAYFRFGFKIFRATGALFGDGSLLSNDPNLIIHVGRNYWSRPTISKNDLFLTAYENGLRLGWDRKLFHIPKRASVHIQLTIDQNSCVWFFVDGSLQFQHTTGVESYERIAAIAWGDHDEYSVEVSDLSLSSAERREPQE